MQDARKNFSAVYDAWARATKIRGGISGPHLIRSDGRQVIPAFGQACVRKLPQNVVFIITAGNEHDHFRRVCIDLFSRRSYAALACFAKGMIATGNGTLFGNPMAGSKRRFQPFEHQSARVMSAFSPFANTIETSIQVEQQFVRLTSPASERTQRRYVIEDFSNRSWLERNNAHSGLKQSRGTLDSFVTFRTDVAKLLGENQIGAEFTQSCLIEIVN